MRPPTFFFFLKLALAVQGFLRFYNGCPPQKPLWVQATFAPHNLALPLASAALPLLWNCAAERAGPVWMLSLGWAECQGECKKPASVPGSFSLPSLPCSWSKHTHMQSSQVESQLPTAYLLALPAFQPAKWTHLPGVGPTPPGLVWPICGLNCLLPWEDLSPCNPPPLLSPLPGAQVLTLMGSLPFLPRSTWIFFYSLDWTNLSANFQFSMRIAPHVDVFVGGGEFPICHLGLPLQLIFKWFGRKKLDS